MKDRTIPKPRKIQSNINLTFNLEPTTQGLLSFELDCWRPYYPLVCSYYLGFDSDWPFGEGDLPQVGATAPAVPGSRNTFTVNFATTGLITWQNSPYSSGKLALSSPALEMMYVSLRLFRPGTGRQAWLHIDGLPAGTNDFEI